MPVSVKIVRQDVKKVKAFLTNSNNWTQRVMARNIENLEVSVKSPAAVRFDIVGAEVKLDICVQAKWAIQNSAIKMFSQSKGEVNDGFNLPDGLNRQEKLDLCHQNIMMVIEDALTSPDFDKPLPRPVRKSEEKEKVKERKIEPMEIGSSIAPKSLSMSDPESGIIFWYDEPITWFSDKNVVPVICQLLDRRDNDQLDIHVTEVTWKLCQKVINNEVTLRSILERPGVRYWAVVTDHNYNVFAAIEQTKNPVPEDWLPQIDLKV